MKITLNGNGASKSIDFDSGRFEIMETSNVLISTELNLIR